ncbi:MAG: TerC family protein [Alphaproteobacteria bacterium]|nr:TerC family protein [Alphaproteobacteria bacterium]
MDFVSVPELWALATVIVTDVALAGDNAIVVGMAAAGLAAEQRRKAIMIGIVAATVLRVVFALATSQLLQIIGLMLAGGILLLWVSWKLWRELREAREEAEGEAVLEGADTPVRPAKSFRDAVTQIVIADVSMSLDNVLAVAGAAREHTWVLVVGLALSVALMGLAATFVARLLTNHRWIGYLGLAVILYIAIKMIWDGAQQVANAMPV